MNTNTVVRGLICFLVIWFAIDSVFRFLGKPEPELEIVRARIFLN
jgi:hypothetical protein